MLVHTRLLVRSVVHIHDLHAFILKCQFVVRDSTLVGSCDNSTTVRTSGVADFDVLALVLHLGLPVWSSDNDFEETGIEWYTTAELLQKLGIRKQNR